MFFFSNVIPLQWAAVHLITSWLQHSLLVTRFNMEVSRVLIIRSVCLIKAAICGKIIPVSIRRINRTSVSSKVQYNWAFSNQYHFAYVSNCFVKNRAHPPFRSIRDPISHSRWLFIFVRSGTHHGLLLPIRETTNPIFKADFVCMSVIYRHADRQTDDRYSMIYSR